MKIANEMFRSSGPLGDFGARIHMAFLIGMFSLEGHAELTTIRKIRNLFAHNLRINGFNAQRVNDLVSNLVKHERSFTLTNLDRASVKRSLLYAPDPTPPVDSRDQYIRSCKYYTAILSMQLPGRVTMPALLLASQLQQVFAQPPC